MNPGGGPPVPNHFSLHKAGAFLVLLGWYTLVSSTPINVTFTNRLGLQPVPNYVFTMFRIILELRKAVNYNIRTNG